jgi:hypothetical protein
MGESGANELTGKIWSQSDPLSEVVERSELA